MILFVYSIYNKQDIIYSLEVLQSPNRGQISRRGYCNGLLSHCALHRKAQCGHSQKTRGRHSERIFHVSQYFSGFSLDHTRSAIHPLVLIEFKGDDRDNSDSKMKLELGRQWQAQAGPNYRYFIVFRNKDFNIGGAYRLDEFTEIMKEL